MFYKIIAVLFVFVWILDTRLSGAIFCIILIFLFLHSELFFYKFQRDITNNKLGVFGGFYSYILKKVFITTNMSSL